VGNKPLWEQTGYVETDNMNKGAFWEALRNPDFRASCYNCVRCDVSLAGCKKLKCRHTESRRSTEKFYYMADLWEWNGK